MKTYRIFTNDRGLKGGVPLYSALKDVRAASAEAALLRCPPQFTTPYVFGRAVAINWPTQSGDELLWLKKHVGGPPR